MSSHCYALECQFGALQTALRLWENREIAIHTNEGWTGLPLSSTRPQPHSVIHDRTLLQVARTGTLRSRALAYSNPPYFGIFQSIVRATSLLRHNLFLPLVEPYATDSLRFSESVTVAFLFFALLLYPVYPFWMPNCEVYFSKMPVDTKPKIHEGRKSSKPLMEKRRRARINDSLSQLKSLILEATNKDSSRHSKLEKADILEMTVKHLRTVQRSHISAPHGGDPSRFRQGYSECIHEVARFLTNIENIGSADMRVTLINHLANACSPPTPSSPPAPQQPSPPTSPVAASPIGAMQQAQPMVSYASQQVTAPSPAIASAAGNCNAAQVPSQPIRVQISPAVSSPPSATTANVVTAAQLQQQKFVPSRIEAASPSGSIATTHTTTNTITAPAQVLSGFPVGIPGNLPTGGEITLVLPPQALAGGQLPSHFIPVYAQSAPVLTSPTISPASQGPVHVAVSSAESPKAYARVQFSPSPISPPQQLTTVQTPTLVAVPAPARAPVMQQHTKVAFQTVQHPQPPSPPKTMLQAVNMQQQVCKEEPVWRPWNHMK